MREICSKICYGPSIVDFEQVNAGWVIAELKALRIHNT